MQRPDTTPELDGEIDALQTVVAVQMNALGAISHYLYKTSQFTPDEK